jgi:hypothetical protein
LKLREFLAGPDTGRDLIEMVVYAGLPPAMMIWQEERDKKNKFVQWLRSNGFMVVTKDGSPAEEGRHKANVDVMMGIDALELSEEIQPDVVILVAGDTDFAYLAIKLRRRGIRVEVASVAENLGNMLRSLRTTSLIWHRCSAHSRYRFLTSRYGASSSNDGGHAHDSDQERMEIAIARKKEAKRRLGVSGHR